MAKVERFEDLLCWQKSRELVKTIYQISSSGELSRDFDLRAQFRRAGLSTMNNIAEGFSRFSRKEFIRFLDYSSSSCGEIKSMIYVLEDLNYVKKEELVKLQALVDDTRNLTLGFIRYLVKQQ